jgi:hypothetical protein
VDAVECQLADGVHVGRLAGGRKQVDGVAHVVALRLEHEIAARLGTDQTSRGRQPAALTPMRQPQEARPLEDPARTEPEPGQLDAPGADLGRRSVLAVVGAEAVASGQEAGEDGRREGRSRAISTWT